MEAIKAKGIAKNGEVIISVPSSFNEWESEVIILSPSIDDTNAETNRHEEKVNRLMSIAGTAKHPDLSNDILDVYEQ